MKKYLIVFFLVIHSAFAEDPTHGKPLLNWVWEDQFKPTLKESISDSSLILAGSGLASAVTVRQFDKKVYYYNDKHPLVFSESTAQQFGKIGNGFFSIGIAVTQSIFDQENGFAHSRALIMTSLSHSFISRIARRNRPGNRDDAWDYPSSFPSGHTSNAFATAGSLAYSYGWKVGVPAYAVASAIGISRIRENRHWASDVVCGAFLGTFWARASYTADKKKKEDDVTVYPSMLDGGMMMTAAWQF